MVFSFWLNATPNNKQQTPNNKHQTPNNKHQTTNIKHQTTNTILIRPRSTMDSIRVSEAPDPSSILGEATQREFWSICVG